MKGRYLIPTPWRARGMKDALMRHGAGLRTCAGLCIGMDSTIRCSSISLPLIPTSWLPPAGPRNRVGLQIPIG